MADDDDALDAEDLAFGRWLCRTIYHSFVDELLAGNDAQCFTTEDYREHYEAGTLALGGVPLTAEAARTHLRSLPGVVREVRPDVWAACNDPCPP